MDDTISRQATIKHLKHRLYETAMNNPDLAGVFSEIADNRVETWITELPTAEPRKGYWSIEDCHAATYKYCCSECKAHHRARYDYCPTCGADMRGDKKGMKALPSAQTEIIHCGECKHWRQQTNYAGAPLSFGFCESDDMWQSLYGETYEIEHIDTDEDFYCGYAERRTDE